MKPKIYLVHLFIFQILLSMQLILNCLTVRLYCFKIILQSIKKNQYVLYWPFESKTFVESLSSQL